MKSNLYIYQFLLPHKFYNHSLHISSICFQQNAKFLHLGKTININFHSRLKMQMKSMQHIYQVLLAHKFNNHLPHILSIYFQWNVRFLHLDMILNIKFYSWLKTQMKSKLHIYQFLLPYKFYNHSLHISSICFQQNAKFLHLGKTININFHSRLKMQMKSMQHIYQVLLPHKFNNHLPHILSIYFQWNVRFLHLDMILNIKFYSWLKTQMKSKLHIYQFLLPHKFYNHSLHISSICFQQNAKFLHLGKTINIKFHSRLKSKMKSNLYIYQFLLPHKFYNHSLHISAFIFSGMLGFSIWT